MKKLYFILFGVTALMLTASLTGCLEGDKKNIDPLSGLNYKNNDYGFGLNPPEGWTVDTSNQNIIVAFIGPTVDNFAINIVATAGQFQTGETPYMAADKIIENLSIYFSNFSLVSRGNTTTNSMNSHGAVYTFDQGDIALKQKQVIIEKNGKALILTLSSTLGSFDTYNLAFVESLNSVKIIW